MASELSSIESLLLKAAQVYKTLSLRVSRSTWMAKDTQPDYVRTYQGLGDNRVFIPASASSSARRPLVVNIHGGGWALGNPSEDDPLCRYLADYCNCTVVGINYPKAPQRPFPGGLRSHSRRHSRELNVDTSRVTLIGSSAGGNLVLSTAQAQNLIGKITAVIALYPLVDFSMPRELKLENRPDASEKKDMLYSAYHLLRRQYLQNGESLKDPRVSPFFFPGRTMLPKHVYIIGCARDMLCYEASLFADKLVEGDKGKKIETEYGWRSGAVVWDLIKDQVHAFNQFKAKDAEKEIKRVQEIERLHKRIGDWLISDVFAGARTEH
ncbi:hypothetical protein D6C80_02406 [Aureobasidium pullulans]|nr:hypothetical protein D6C80_02406 [Aureobasidium pullulans]